MMDENSQMQAAVRRNLQIRGWRSYLERVRRILSADESAITLLEPEQSLELERRLLAKTRAGLEDDSILRTTELSRDQLESTIEKAFANLALGEVVVIPINSPQFTFSLTRPPTPAQVRHLVSLDGDTLYVVRPDLSRGIGVDEYQGEMKQGTFFELDSWK